MVYLLRSGDWYRIGHSDSRYIIDSEDNPSLEMVGEIPGGISDCKKWVSKVKKIADDVRGDWYMLKDDILIGELESAFTTAQEFTSGGIELRYDISKGGSQARIVQLYSQMSGYLESNPAIVSDSAMWRSRLLGHCEVLKAVGVGVFRWYPSMGIWDIHWHDGKIWSPISEVELRVALQYFCLDDVGVSATEWVRNEKKYLSALRDGASMSPLSVSRSIVGFQNGVYDFSDPISPVYHPFSDKMPIVDLLPYEYDMKATCPLWVSFLAKALPRVQVEMLRRYLGLALVDRRKLPYKVESSLWLVGPGGAGKSTIMNTIRYVVGDSRVSSVNLGALLGGNAENRARFVAAIDGKAFNYCGEVQIEDMSRGGDTFKSLCSGEPQMMRRIGGNVETAYEIPYLIFNMNRKPRNRIIDSALRRRLLFVSFPTAVRDCDRDPLLEDKLRAEAAGIRNWLLEGYRRFVDDGGVINPTADSTGETDLWMEENGQSVELYFTSIGVRPYGFTGENEKGEWVIVRVLYDGYFEWCNKHGIEPDVDLVGMGRELRRIGYRAKRTAQGMTYKIFRDKKN